MTSLLIAALVATPLPLADLSPADVSSRAHGDGPVIDSVVRRAHWLVDLALTPGSKAALEETGRELARLTEALDGAQSWWGGEISAEAGVQADKAFTLHYAARLALITLAIAGSAAMHDLRGQELGSLRKVASAPTLLHSLGPLHRRWRKVRRRLRDSRADRGRSLGWAVPYIERQARLLQGRTRRRVGHKAPTAEPSSARLMPGGTRAAAWLAGSEIPRQDVGLSTQEVRKLLAKLKPGDLILSWRSRYAGLADDPVVAIVMGESSGLDAAFRGDKEAALFLGRRGVMNRRPSLYMHLRFPVAWAKWKQLDAPAAAVASGDGVALWPLTDALSADAVRVLRPQTSVTGRLRAVALAVHHFGRKMGAREYVEACFGAGDGQPGIETPTLKIPSESPDWELVVSKSARP